MKHMTRQETFIMQLLSRARMHHRGGRRQPAAGAA
jgi:hypothetical protein